MRGSSKRSFHLQISHRAMPQMLPRAHPGRVNGFLTADSQKGDVTRITAKVEGRVLATLSRNPVDEDPFPAIAANCHVAGYDLTHSSWFDGMADPRGLPLYPWDRQSFWFGLTAEAADPVNSPFEHPLLGFRQRGPVPCWINHLDAEVLPWIADHAIEGVPVLPAAGILEMACAAARGQWPDALVLELRDLEMRRPLPFDKGRMREVRAQIESEEGGDWELASRPRLSNEPFTVHAVGRLGADTDTRRILRFSDEMPTRQQIDQPQRNRFPQAPRGPARNQCKRGGRQPPGPRRFSGARCAQSTSSS